MKKLLSCILLLSLLLGLTGCHGKKEMAAFQLPEVFDESRNYQITFWAKNDTNAAQVAVYEQAIADFQQIYPNITVNLRLYTDYGRIYNDVITNIATNTTPNVCITYPDHIATYLTGGTTTVVTLDELLTHPVYGLGGSGVKFDAPTVDEIVPQFLQEGYLGDLSYALPYMRSTEACYVNKTFVEKLGYTLPDVLTWDFIWEVSEAATAKDADGNYLVNGQNVLIPFLYKSTDNMMIQYLHQAGAGYSTADAQVKIFNDTTEEFLFEIAEHVQSGAFSTFKISSYPANFLNAGQCIFAVDSTAGATWMGSEAPLLDIPEDKLVQFETAVLPIPQLDPENPSMISQGPSMCIFNKEDPQEVLASWLFAQFMLTDNVQISYAQTEGYLPVTTKALESEVYQQYTAAIGQDNDLHYDVKLKASKLLQDHIENTFVTPVFNGSASLRNAAGQMIEDVAKSVRRHKTVDETFISQLYRDVRALYRLDQITGQNKTRQEFGALPTQSVILLCCIGAAWVCIGIYVVAQKVKSKKRTIRH